MLFLLGIQLHLGYNSTSIIINLEKMNVILLQQTNQGILLVHH